MRQSPSMSHPPSAEKEPTGSEPIHAFGDPRAVCLRWDVPPEFEGTRADQYLATKVGRLSRARAARIVRNGDFRTPTGPLKPSSRVKAGPVELWRIPPDSPDEFGAAPAILFEDDSLLVIDKPPDLAVHPSARYLYRTLTAWLKQHANRDPNAPDAIAHPSHRLDRETSGVMVCAKTKAAQRATKGAFLERTATKMYAAIVRGTLNENADIHAPLEVQGDRGLVRIKMVVDESAPPAQTHVVPLLSTADVTLVACLPKTGRQHQIRAHLATIGHPLVGDKLYAMGEWFFDAFTKGEVDVEHPDLDHHRHALHAYALQLGVDDTGQQQTFVAPLPDDMMTLLSDLGRATVDAALADAWRHFQGE